MKYRMLDSFRRDFARLPLLHRQLFLTTLREHFLPAIRAGSVTGIPPWPTRLRVHRLSKSDVYTITWSFSSPDGRATFHLDKNQDGEPLVVWRRIGDHGIYRTP